MVEGSFDYITDGHGNIRPIKRARNVEDQDMNTSGSNGKGQGSMPNRGPADGKKDRRRSCNECRRYVYIGIERYPILTIFRLKLKVRRLSVNSADRIFTHRVLKSATAIFRVR